MGDSVGRPLMSSPQPFPTVPAAERLAALYRTEVEPWMLSPIWTLWIGCDECARHPITAGRQAPCWGKDRCHGLGQGCGCAKCYQTVRDTCLDILAKRQHDPDEPT